MDILYVVGNGSNWDNNELRYSLRSLEKFGKNVGRIFIATKKLPDFINPETVTHIAVCDESNVKHRNIMCKVEYAMQHSDIADDFLLSSDDHFYIKPTDFDNYPLYHKGEINSRNSFSSYCQSMRNTKIFLERHGMGILSTNPHCNTHFNRPLYMKNIDMMNDAKEVFCGIEVNCLMGNLLIASGVRPVRYRDIKVKRFVSREELLAKLGDTHCFSISDKSLACGMKEYLQELFPNKSKYEK